jgi:hypothetical protein
MPVKSPYSLHPSVAYVQAVIDNLEANTGKSLAGWLRLLKAKGPKDAKRRRDWLKSQGLGSNQASLVAEHASGTRANVFANTKEGYLAAATGYVQRQYGGKKAALRPLYELVLATGLATGPDAAACPCQTMVPLFRKHVFAQIKPSTLGRIDLGLALGNPKQLKAPARVLETGGFAKKDRITHRIELTKATDVDDTVKQWLEIAYQRDA